MMSRTSESENTLRYMCVSIFQQRDKMLNWMSLGKMEILYELIFLFLPHQSVLSKWP